VCGDLNKPTFFMYPDGGLTYSYYFSIISPSLGVKLLLLFQVMEVFGVLIAIGYKDII
jgi:hypothetical protein